MSKQNNSNDGFSDLQDVRVVEGEALEIEMQPQPTTTGQRAKKRLKRTPISAASAAKYSTDKASTDASVSFNTPPFRSPTDTETPSGQTSFVVPPPADPSAVTAVMRPSTDELALSSSDDDDFSIDSQEHTPSLTSPITDVQNGNNTLAGSQAAAKELDDLLHRAIQIRGVRLRYMLLVSLILVVSIFFAVYFSIRTAYLSMVKEAASLAMEKSVDWTVARLDETATSTWNLGQSAALLTPLSLSAAPCFCPASSNTNICTDNDSSFNSSFPFLELLANSGSDDDGGTPTATPAAAAAVDTASAFLISRAICKAATVSPVVSYRLDSQQQERALVARGNCSGSGSGTLKEVGAASLPPMSRSAFALPVSYDGSNRSTVTFSATVLGNTDSPTPTGQSGVVYDTLTTVVRLEQLRTFLSGYTPHEGLVATAAYFARGLDEELQLLFRSDTDTSVGGGGGKLSSELEILSLGAFHRVCAGGTQHTVPVFLDPFRRSSRSGNSEQEAVRAAGSSLHVTSHNGMPERYSVCLMACSPQVMTGTSGASYSSRGTNCTPSTATLFVHLHVDVTELSRSTFFEFFKAGSIIALVLFLCSNAHFHMSVAVPTMYLHKRIVATLTGKERRWTKSQRLLFKVTKPFWVGDLRSLIKTFSLMSFFYMETRKYLPDHLRRQQEHRLHDEEKVVDLLHHMEAKEAQVISGRGSDPQVFPASEESTAAGSASGSLQISAGGGDARHSPQSASSVQLELEELPAGGRKQSTVVFRTNECGKDKDGSADTFRELPVVFATSAQEGAMLRSGRSPAGNHFDPTASAELEDINNGPLARFRSEINLDQLAGSFTQNVLLSTSQGADSPRPDEELGDAKGSFERARTFVFAPSPTSNQISPMLSTKGHGSMRAIADATVMVVSMGHVEAAYAMDFHGAQRQHTQIVGTLLAIIRRHRGDICAKRGDSFAVVWNAYERLRTHASRGFECALEVADVFQSVRAQGLRLGISVHSGPLVCGDIGDDTLEMDAIFGNTIDFAFGLADLHMALDWTHLLFSEPVKRIIANRFDCLIVDVIRDIPKIPLPGTTCSHHQHQVCSTAQQQHQHLHSGTPQHCGSKLVNIYDVRREQPEGAGGGTTGAAGLASTVSIRRKRGAVQRLKGSHEEDETGYKVLYTRAFTLFRQHKFSNALLKLGELHAQFGADSHTIRLDTLCRAFSASDCDGGIGGGAAASLPMPYERLFPQWVIFEAAAFCALSHPSSGRSLSLAVPTSKTKRDSPSSRSKGQQAVQRLGQSNQLNESAFGVPEVSIMVGTPPPSSLSMSCEKRPTSDSESVGTGSLSPSQHDVTIPPASARKKPAEPTPEGSQQGADTNRKLLVPNSNDGKTNQFTNFDVPSPLFLKPSAPQRNFKDEIESAVKQAGSGFGGKDGFGPAGGGGGAHNALLLEDSLADLNMRDDSFSGDASFAMKRCESTTTFNAAAAQQTLPSEFEASRGTMYLRSNNILGVGTYGSVYLGVEKHTGKFVAMKILPLPDDDSEREKIVNEVQIMQTVRDNHIVEFYDFAVVGYKIVFVMECVVPGCLSSMLKNFDRLAPVTTVNFMRDILQGLAKLHSVGIIHRDVKPQNVLITSEGVCKLSDFGAAASLGELVREAGGGVVGTPLYMAPEAARGDATALSDIWSVGIMFLELITGELPYPMNDDLKCNPALFVFRIGTGAFLPTIPDEIGSVSREFVEHCLVPDESLRYSAEELLSLPFFTV